jgi:hypothetical protein
VSPIYAAPEIYIDPARHPYAFDVYSAAVVWCGLLFRLDDAKALASFKQQLASAGHDLALWLRGSLAATVLPESTEAGLAELSRFGYRPWRLLRRMLSAAPSDRPTAAACAEEVRSWAELPPTAPSPPPSVDDFLKAVVPPDGALGCDLPAGPRELVTAQFKAGKPLGLILADDEVKAGVCVAPPPPPQIKPPPPPHSPRQLRHRGAPPLAGVPQRARAPRRPAAVRVLRVCEDVRAGVRRHHGQPGERARHDV